MSVLCVGDFYSSSESALLSLLTLVLFLLFFFFLGGGGVLSSSDSELSATFVVAPSSDFGSNPLRTSSSWIQSSCFSNQLENSVSYFRLVSWYIKFLTSF